MKLSLLKVYVQRLVLLLLCFSTWGVESALAATSASTIEVSDAWVRATPPGSTVAAGYFTVHNKGARDVRIVSLRSPIAKTVDVHEMTMDGGQMQMRALSEGLRLGAGQTIQLSPGGYHLMFSGLGGALVNGASVALTLTLDDGSSLDLKLPVRDADASGEAMHHHDH